MLSPPWSKSSASILVGKTLAETRIGSSTGLIILALTRFGRSETLPSRQTVLRGGDGILVQGRVDQFRELQRWSDLVIEREAPVLKSMVAAKIAYAEVNLAEGSPLVGELVRHAGFRTRFNISVVGIYRRNNYRLTNLAYVPLRAGDRILVQVSWPSNLLDQTTVHQGDTVTQFECLFLIMGNENGRYPQLFNEGF